MRTLGLAVAILILTSAGAEATIRNYTWTSNITLFNVLTGSGIPTSLGAGSWEGNKTIAVIDDGITIIPPSTVAPTLLAWIIQYDTLLLEIACASTSGVVGCRYDLELDFLINSAAAGVLPGTRTFGTSIHPPLGGDVITWPTAPVAVVGGRGQKCTASIDPIANPTPTPADIATVASYCLNVLQTQQGVWQVGGPFASALITPNASPPWNFNLGYAGYVIPGSYVFLQIVVPGFAAPGGSQDNAASFTTMIYGIYSGGAGVSGHVVPLAPIAAFTMALGLAYLGVQALRARSA